MQESRRRDPISATPARWRRKLFASPRLLPDQVAARKRTTAFPGISSLILCEGALALANSSPRPETQDHGPGHSGWFCQILRGTSQILPAYSLSLSGQNASSGSDRKDRELRPGQTYPWCRRWQDAADCLRVLSAGHRPSSQSAEWLRYGAASLSRNRGTSREWSIPHFS